MTQAAIERVTVLSNPGVWREGDNPFLKLLFESFDDTISLDPFSWRRALGGRYDVLHVHWLEYLVRSENPAARPIKMVLFALLLLRLTLLRTPSVWTVHNDTPHDVSANVVERALLALWSRRVTHKVFLTRAAQSEAGSPARSSVIVHGDYRPVLVHGTPPPPAQPPAEILHFGHLRPYKGIEPLVEAFVGAWPDEAHRPRLRIVGRAKDPAYGAALAALVDGVAGVELTEEFLPDADLEAIIGAADLVVLPYKKMNNSGAALLALSIGRPVLVPDGPTTRELQAEFGRDWVSLFQHPFGPADLARVVEVRDAPLRHQVPDMRARDWSVLGRMYSDLFHELAHRPRVTSSALPSATRRPMSGF